MLAGPIRQRSGVGPTSEPRRCGGPDDGWARRRVHPRSVPGIRGRSLGAAGAYARQAVTDPPRTQDDASGPAPFAEQFAAAAPALFAWASCRIGRELRARIDVEDLVQEVGVRACLRATEFDPRRGTFRQWLLGFANRVWLETLRELGRDPLGPRRRLGGDSQLPEVAHSVTTISRRVANDETARACRARIDALDDEDRRLLVAVGIEGLAHAEAAALLGIGEEASRKRWQRLRERLRDDPVLRLCGE